MFCVTKAETVSADFIASFLKALHRVTHASSVSPKDHDNRRQFLKCRLQRRALL